MRKKAYSITRLVMPLLLILFWAQPIGAEMHALLIGVGKYLDYARIFSLAGPANDVSSLKETLIGKYGFLETRIRILLNEDATKQNILGALSELDKTTQPGDFIFIYFSGHGTSAYDPKQNLPLIGSTGALIPYEFRIHKDDPQRSLSSLVIGRTDLRPIFTKLDQRRKVLVIFDTCFSGNAVRSPMSQRVARYIPLEPALRKPELRLDKGEPYPYQNIIYISAADETERAVDVARSAYDGRSHGALTDALLRGLNGSADTNHDGMITYEEIYQFVKRTTQEYGQTPQILHREPLGRPVFENTLVGHERSREKQSMSPGSSSGSLRVKVETSDKASILNKIGSLPDVKVADREHDLLLKQEGRFYSLYLSGGERLCRASRFDEAFSRIVGYIKTRELITLNNPKQPFNIWLKAGETEGRTVFFDGENIDLTVRSEEKAYLLLLNIDPKGNVCVLLPQSESSEASIDKGVVQSIGGLGKVGPPFGVEFLKLFAFREKVDGLSKFAAGNGILEAQDDRLPLLLDMIKQRSDWAEMVQQVITLKKN